MAGVGVDMGIVVGVEVGVCVVMGVMCRCKRVCVRGVELIASLLGS